jgi:hypothetical protein
MNTPNRLVDMILRGKSDQFKTVMIEELRERAAILMESLFKTESKSILNTQSQEPVKQIKEETAIAPILISQFQPQNSYQLKDGNIGVLDADQRQMVSELYKKLNNDNKQRMVKLLSESKESFNRVLNLAKIERK